MYPMACIAELAEVKGGKRMPANAFLVTTPTSHPYIRGRDIRNGKIAFDQPMYVRDEDFEPIRRYTVNRGDVCITIVGNIGDIGITPPHLHGASLTENAVKLVNLRGDIDARFLAFALLAPEAQSQMKQSAAGAAQPKLGIYKVNEIRVAVPPLPIQQRIAGILSAYDELIENSQRRIKILESMARALYREWFVHFRFPGHENHPRLASPLGEIPQGWEVKTIADVCESVSYGYTASASREEVGPKFLRITDIVPATIDWAGVPFCEIPEDKAPKYLLKHGDIVVARTGATTGYAKRLNKLHPDTVFASYLVRARAKAGVSNRMLGIVMESDEYKQYIQTNIGGAAQPQANAVVLTSMRLAVPTSSVGEKFDRLVAPLIDEAELLAVKIQNLRRTRDLLLPRLLSGQVDVEAA